MTTCALRDTFVFKNTSNASWEVYKTKTQVQMLPRGPHTDPVHILIFLARRHAVGSTHIFPPFGLSRKKQTVNH